MPVSAMILAVISSMSLASLIPLIIGLIVLGVCLYLLRTLPIDNTIKTIINVIVVIAACLWLLRWAGMV